MKARVKATGEIVGVKAKTYIANSRWDIGIRYEDIDRNIYYEEDLDFENIIEGKADVKEKSFPKDEPDYWEKLKHQYAGMAMHSLIPRFERMRQDWINGEFEDGYRITKEEANIALKDHAEAAADIAKVYATALVNRLKEE